MTVLATAVGAASILLVGQFVSYIMHLTETNTVRRLGHIAVYRRGYFQFGAGSPNAFGIHDYKSILDVLANDPQIKPKIGIITPTIITYGLAGNFEKETHKGVYFTGVVPGNYVKQLAWDQYGFGEAFPPLDTGLNDKEPKRAYIGMGVARILGLCSYYKHLNLPNCPPRPENMGDNYEPDNTAPVRDFSGIPEEGLKEIEAAAHRTVPQVDVLAATARGRPNIIALDATTAVPLGNKEFDESYVVAPFEIGQRLVFGSDTTQSMSISLQLHDSDDIPSVQSRITKLISEHKWDLEAFNVFDLSPLYKQNLVFWNTIFNFITGIMVVIVVFSVTNTMGMAVMERIREIGTLRSLGVKRDGVRMQFITEGMLLGALGSTLGIVFEAVIATVLNASGLRWIPPNNVNPIPLKLLPTGMLKLTALTWIALTAMGILASLLPAHRAAKLKIVDALEHL